MTAQQPVAMIYHVPYPLSNDERAASAIRPARMRRAFKALGIDVWEVSGPVAQRRSQIRDIKARVKSGVVPAFAYSESSSMPTPLTESHHLPVAPRLDLAFLAWCRRKGIPTGLFYRDIYWQFPEYVYNVNRLVAVGTRLLYRRDLRMYGTALDRLYLPSMRMADYVPNALADRAQALPPGADIADIRRLDSPLSSLLFVGGLGDFYRLHECASGVAQTPSAQLVICTREAQWQSVAGEYQPYLSDRVRVEHESGPGLNRLYAEADIGVLFLEASKYREFAAPMKLYEYLAHGKPVVVTEGTLAAELISASGAGWVLPYNAAALSELLAAIQADPVMLHTATNSAIRERENHSWIARARQVADDLAPQIFA